MKFARFLTDNNQKTLISAFIYSDMSFMVWVLMGPLVVFIAQDLALSQAQQYTLVVIPLFSGVLFRIPVGVLVDGYGPRRIGLALQVGVILALLLAFLSNITSLAALYTLAAALGLAGTSMAVALPLSSSKYPDQHQGLVLGIAGAASSGTIFAVALAPMLAQSFGWRAVFGFAVLPLIFAVVYFYRNASDSDYQPQKQPLFSYVKSAKEIDVLWFMLFYGLSFGGVIALSSVMVLYFHHNYQLEVISAGYYTAACILAGTIGRPFGGAIADRQGGIRSMQRFFALAGVCLLLVGFSLPLGLTLVLLIIGTGALGMASGAVFQLVPLRFRANSATVTGLIGTAGGLGGFFLAWLLGESKQLSDGFALGFIAYAMLAVLCLYGIQKVKSRWRTTWGAGEVTSARV